LFVHPIPVQVPSRSNSSIMSSTSSECPYSSPASSYAPSADSTKARPKFIHRAKSFIEEIESRGKPPPLPAHASSVRNAEGKSRKITSTQTQRSALQRPTGRKAAIKDAGNGECTTRMLHHKVPNNEVHEETRESSVHTVTSAKLSNTRLKSMTSSSSESFPLRRFAEGTDTLPRSGEAPRHHGDRPAMSTATVSISGHYNPRLQPLTSRSRSKHMPKSKSKQSDCRNKATVLHSSSKPRQRNIAVTSVYAAPGTSLMYCVDHFCLPGVTHQRAPFLTLHPGDICEIISEAPVPWRRDGRDRMLVCRDERGRVGWCLCAC
jgi:hypothetical protein